MRCQSFEHVCTMDVWMERFLEHGEHSLVCVYCLCIMTQSMKYCVFLLIP